MNYLVFDLEFNQAFNFKKGTSMSTNIRCPFEIIQIGAVKLDKNLNVMATFESMVKPKLYTRIHPYVKKMTNIAKEDLKTAESFKSVYKEFIEFINDVSVLCVWGTADIKELFRNIQYHDLDVSLIPQKYIDVQHYTSKHLKHPKGTTIGLSNAAKSFNIPINLNFHNALNDASYTAEVFKKLITNQIKPDIYQSSNDNKSNKGYNKKITLDDDKLIKQFEKIFHRKMTSEEQTIIKLAYKMGSTNQFKNKPEDGS